MAKYCMSPRGAKCSICIGAVILTIALAALITFPFLYKKLLKKQITLTEGTMALDAWVDIPTNFHFKLYFFNITNADRFLKNKEPLNVVEVGPYVYKNAWTKYDHFWNSNGTISYRELKTYPFVPELSDGSEDDKIFTLNGPMIIASNMAKHYSQWERWLLSGAMGVFGEKIITEKSIKQLAFEGYDDIIISLAPRVKKDIPYKDGKFGWLMYKNATDEGLFTVYTGDPDNSLTNKITRWNGQDKLPFWKNDSCNKLTDSTNIEMGPPLPDVPGKYTFFQPLLCRAFSLNYTEDVTHLGIPTKRFKTTYDLLANSTENPVNYCYETEELPSGILNISSCQFGAPVFLSYPHFYMADPIYLKNIRGLNPNEKDHQTYVDVDPVTGFTLEISAKYQMNLQFEKVTGILQTYGIREGIYPVLWIEIASDLPQSWASFYKSQLINPKIIAYSLGGIFVLFSVVLIIVGIAYVHLNQKAERDDPLIDVNENKAKNKNCKLSQSNQGFVSDYGGTVDNNVTVQTNR